MSFGGDDVEGTPEKEVPKTTRGNYKVSYFNRLNKTLDKKPTSNFGGTKGSQKSTEAGMSGGSPSNHTYYTRQSTKVLTPKTIQFDAPKKKTIASKLSYKFSPKHGARNYPKPWTTNSMVSPKVNRSIETPTTVR